MEITRGVLTMSKEFNHEYLNSEKLLQRNDIELDYHYNALGYLKLVMGGTAIPKSIDITRKEDHKLICTINNKKLLDQLADD